MSDASSPLWRVLGLLGDNPRKSGSGYEVRCPAHDDRHASLSVGLGDDGRVLLDCKAGCLTESVLVAVGLGWDDLFEKSRSGNPVRRFRLLDHAGRTVAEHVREDLPNGDKRIHWEHNGQAGLNGTAIVDLPLYGAAQLASTPKDVPVVLCEGEKAAQALRDRGVVAVATVTGAGATPSARVLEVLAGREVWLWPDNDDTGRQHMQRIAAQLTQSVVRWVDWQDAPNKGDDAADYLARGGTAEGIERMLRQVVMHAASGPRLDVVRMSDVQPEPIEWLWRGRFARGKPTLLMGDPGLGKSLITHWTAATVSHGGEWPDGGRAEQGAALLFTIEDGLADTVSPRLRAAGADMPHVLAVRGVVDPKATLSERMFALTEHLDLLEELIVAEHAVLVVMDPITAYLGPDVNSHKEADVRAVLGPLQLLAERTRIALVMLMHLNKGTGVTALYRATGSIAFPAVARVVLGVAPDPNDDDGKRRLLLPVKMNIGKLPEGIGYHIETARGAGVLPRVSAEDQPPVLIWDLEPVAVDATSAMDRNGSVQEMGAVAETKQALLQILASGRITANECKRQIKESVGTTSETVLSRARKELGVRVKKEGFGASGVWFWELAPIDSRAREIRALGSLIAIESSNVSSKTTNSIKDHKDSLVDEFEDLRRCRKCSRGVERHGPQDPVSCEWEELKE